jgi:anaerobic sulfite reductase subunit C
MLDYAALKSGGFIKQPEGDYFTVRILVPGGRATAGQVDTVQQAARKYGQGYLHLTARQGFELPWVRPQDFDALRADLSKAAMGPAGCGPRIRNIMACPGSPTCGRSLADVYAVAKTLSDQYAGRQVNIKKLKIGLSGCPNSCSSPQTKDIGFMATAEPELVDDKCNACGLCIDACRERAISLHNVKATVNRSLCVNCGDCIAVCPSDAWATSRRGFTIFVGGNVGRHPRFGVKVAEFVPLSEASYWVEGLLGFLDAHGTRAVRLGALLEQTGAQALRTYLPKAG